MEAGRAVRNVGHRGCLSALLWAHTSNRTRGPGEAWGVEACRDCVQSHTQNNPR